MRLLTRILLAITVLVTAPGTLFAFTAVNDDGVTIYYQRLSDSKCEVTWGAEYSGSITIPTSVTYNGNTYAVTSIGSGAMTVPASPP